MADVQVIHGDCLDVLPTLASGSVDAVIADPPYGTTACKWDSIIPLGPMWAELKRVIKPRGAIVMTASQPFTTTLIASNREWFRYCWVWEKSRPSGFMHCNKYPLKSHEDVCVFASRVPAYYPQKPAAPRRSEGQRRVKAHPAVCQSDRVRTFDNNGEAYPRTVIRIANPNHQTDHPTQKPVALMEYLIRTYTNEGETVLDFCMGSGTTLVAVLQCGRRAIGIERDAGYVEIARRRIAAAQAEHPLFAEGAANGQ